jgi:hypothetical protein
MRKLLTFLIALGAVAPAWAETVTSSFDFGPPSAERIAIVTFTCDACHGAKSVSINGVELKRDATSGGAEVAEIWSGPLPDGVGSLDVTIKSDHAIDDADIFMGSANNPPVHPVIGPVATTSGRLDYVVAVEEGDVVVSVSRASSLIKSTEPPWGETKHGRSLIAGWNIKRSDPAFSITGSSPVSALVIYR